MRIVFMGTPDFSVPTLRALVEAGHEIAAVYTQPPRPAGRGKQERKSPVQLAAEQLRIAVCHPTSLRDLDAQADFHAHEAELAVVVAYGLILPKAVLEAPRRGCLNVHASLLPRWRGAAPIQRAILAGDHVTGVTIMRMERGLDTGPTLASARVPVEDKTSGELHAELAEIGARLMVETLEQLDQLKPEPQPELGATYAAKIDKAEARIDWSKPASEVHNLIRGLSPFPGAWFELSLNGTPTRIKALRSTLGQGSGTPGTLLDNLTIACGSGAVRLTQVQREGKGAMDAATFLRGAGTLPPTVR